MLSGERKRRGRREGTRISITGNPHVLHMCPQKCAVVVQYTVSSAVVYIGKGHMCGYKLSVVMW